MRYWILPLVIALLSGCAGDQRNTQQNDFGAGPRLATVPVPVPPAVALPQAHPPEASAGVTRAELESVRSEAIASQNAAQQSLTGLGLQVAKIGDKVEGIHAEFRNDMRAEFQASASANLKIQNSFRAELSATIKNQATLNAKAVADLRAELKAEIQAQAAAQAGIGNKVEAIQSTVSAGRDSIQFTPEMARLLMCVVGAFLLIVLGLCGVLVVAFEMSRRRAEERSRGNALDRVRGIAQRTEVKRSWPADETTATAPKVD